MIEVFQLPGAWGVSSVSPFCVKVEALLRMAELPFRRRSGIPLRGPRGKVPWIVVDGEAIHDSQLIVRALEARGLCTLDQRLSDAERAQGHLLRRTLEEGSYFGMVYGRWIDAASWAIYKPVLGAELPPVFGDALLAVLRRGMRKMLWAQGTGRHSAEWISEQLCDDFSALSGVLGDQPFLFGDAPTTFDATAYAWVASTLGFPGDSPAKRHVMALPNLVSFRQRVEERYYADASEGEP